MTVRILTGDCREVLRTLPDRAVHTCVTSPAVLAAGPERAWQPRTVRWVGVRALADQLYAVPAAQRELI